MIMVSLSLHARVLLIFFSYDVQVCVQGRLLPLIVSWTGLLRTRSSDETLQRNPNKYMDAFENL